MIQTAGTWDRDTRAMYFIASHVATLRHARVHPHMLIAVNTLNDESVLEMISWIENGVQVLVDSGVFELAVSHAKAHGMTMDQVLALPPPEVDGFHELMERYLELVQRVGDRSWGYIEVDLGGRHNKIKTRRAHEKMGLRPIPVYHPINDGWEYFDYLAQRYDRICVGNLVMARGLQRQQMMATIWERKRKYPHLWVHLLGVTLSEVTLSWPPHSCDSSAWLSGVRFASGKNVVANKSVWRLPSSFSYRLGDQESTRKAIGIAAYEGHMQERTMRTLAAEYAELGIDVMGY